MSFFASKAMLGQVEFCISVIYLMFYVQKSEKMRLDNEVQQR